MKKYFLPLLLTFACAVMAREATAQASLETFGHNRVQFQRFEWKFYEAKHFKVYYYGRAGRTLARFVAEQAEHDVDAIEQNAGGIFPDKISIILYNSFDEFRQSNIGLNSDLQMQNNNPAGTVRLVGDKLVIYFSGAHEQLKQQLRQGLAQVVMEHLIFGTNFREMARNAVLLDLPSWVTDGYVDYIVDGWTSKDDNDWKNLITQDKKIYFNDLAQSNPRLAGKAFWKYIATVYGANKVKNILYLVQLKGSINKASKLALNQKIARTFDSVYTFYRDRYAAEQHLFEPLDTANALIRIPIPDDESAIRDIVVSPRGTDVAYVVWKNGEYKVILEKTHKINGKTKRERSTILYGGVRDLQSHADPDYPILAWDNTGFKLGIIYKMGNYIQIKVYNAIKATIWNYRIPKSRVDRVTGFSFLQDDQNIVISAVKNGQSDIYTLYFRGYRLTQITDDAWDDAAPVYVSGGSRKGIIFLSNRPQPYLNIQPLPNELPTRGMNAFFYSTTTKSPELLQLTRNENEHISDIVPYGQDNFAYLSDKNGVDNRYLVLFDRDRNNKDSAFAVPVTNYGRSIKYQNYNPASAKIADAIQYKDAFYVYFKNIRIPQISGPREMPGLPEISFVDDGLKPASKRRPDVKTAPGALFGSEPATPGAQNNEGIKLSDDDAFQSDFPVAALSRKAPQPDTQAVGTAAAREDGFEDLEHGESISSKYAGKELTRDGRHIRYVDSTYLDMRSHRYYLSFRPDFFSIRLDNNLIFNRYQSYDQNAGQYNNPSLGGMIMARLFDKMEDYRFTGGLRIPGNFSGMAYFLQFENFRRRVDWGMTFYREQNKQSYSFLTGGGNQNIIQIPGKTISNIFQGKAAYPLNEVNSLHLYLGARQDKMILKAQDVYGLMLPDVQDVWGMARLEYISDNTREPAMNIFNGLRYKLFAESMYKAYSDNDAYQLSSDTGSFRKHSWIYNFGFDARYYQKIHKNFIFAMRLSGAHSGGTQQIIYYLGGEANAINGKFGNGMTPSADMDYAFQGLAAPLRGYNQNARNGNTFLLANFELRLPVLETFLHRPIQSTILKNLQAVAFLDIGNAWEGLLPTLDNLVRPYQFNWPANTGTPIVNVQIPNSTDYGLAYGYGVGLRTMLWGYFVKADVALNKQRDINWYLSFGFDF
ncbi:MAG TPA: hypothetical protein VFL76_00650 [Edaphocola sp.]|nr:hypothetical protein [Edaphocola sp.]